jgi:hypothetical protein
LNEDRGPDTSCDTPREKQRETDPQTARPRSEKPRTSDKIKCSRRRRGTLRETGRTYQTARLRAENREPAEKSRAVGARFTRSTGRKTRGGAVSRRRHGLTKIRHGMAARCARSQSEKRQRGALARGEKNHNGGGAVRNTQLNKKRTSGSACERIERMAARNPTA